ncbi:heme acquisition protein HasA [Pseudomonas sp. NPDC089734]|uniref:heme acquisition protein HasA n=1 Tax=Pseudomonas sp. NPDC089734 TaxID=3364469 RepID=UPI0037F2D6DD
MSVEISYTSSLYTTLQSAGYATTLQGYLDYYEYTFSVEDHASSGGFNSTSFTPDFQMYGTQYANETEATGYTSAFVAEASAGENLYYSFFTAPTHTLYGELDSLSFGSDLSNVSSQWSLGSTLLDITGLSEIINNGQNADGTVIAGNSTYTSDNDVHNIVWGLLNGETDALAAVLDDYFDLNASLDASGGTLTASSSLVGVAEASESDLALAA